MVWLSAAATSSSLICLIFFVFINGAFCSRSLPPPTCSTRPPPVSTPTTRPQSSPTCLTRPLPPSTQTCPARPFPPPPTMAAELDDRYNLTRMIGEGSFGTAWLASKFNSNELEFVVKIIRTFRGSDAHVSALREAHFGENLTEAGLDITPKFVKAFQRNVGDDLLFHLVYRFEGISLEHLLYRGQNRLWWNWLKTTQEGENAIKGIMFQLISAIAILHDHDIVHRDLKPGNIVICVPTQKRRCAASVEEIKQIHDLKLRLIDMGSATNAYTIQLYGQWAPQCRDYMPPETGYGWMAKPQASYDMWSIGIIFLEMILGTNEIFTISNIDNLTPELVDLVLQYDEGDLIDSAIYRNLALLELCIGEFSDHCSEQDFADKIIARDPFQLGFLDVEALRLARLLLHWDPVRRISARGALQHSYFQQNEARACRGD
nr:putative inactive protein kinase [Quercus suber]